MPGISLIFNKKGTLQEHRETIGTALDKILFNEQYKNNTSYSDDHLFLTINTHPGYPLEIIEDEKYLVAIEGRIYNNKDIHKLAAELTEKAFGKPVRENLATGGLKELLIGLDGDFLLLVLNKSTRELVLLNDPIGRLPVYFYNDDEQWIITRNIRFATSLIQPGPDTVALNQFLLTGYPWGNRTIFKDIHYLPCGSLLSANRNFQVSVQQMLDYNCDDQDYEVKSAKQAAESLYKLFSSSISNRLDNSKNNLLSLSGGLDARTILGECHNQGIQLNCATYLDQDREVIEDVRIARELASVFNIHWELIELEHPREQEFHDLLDIKQGLNYLGMSFILNFFKKIPGENINYITGDGGDKLLPDLRPMHKIHDHKGLLENIIRYQGLFSMAEIADLTGTRNSEIEDSLIAHLEGYPETSVEKKYIRFMVFERGMKWLFEGEDRNRHYFWNIAPFYSYPFFDFAMKCPERYKKDYRLFRDFIELISPELNHIKNANWDMSLSDKRLNRFLFMQKLKSRVPGEVKRVLKGTYRKNNYLVKHPYDGNVRIFQKQITEQNVLDGFIDLKKINFFKSLSLDQFLYVFTLSSVFAQSEAVTSVR